MDDLIWLAIILGLGSLGFAYIRLLALGREGAEV